MNYQAYICKDVVVCWLKPVVGVPLIEGRIGEDRVFGMELSGGRFLVWATESAIVRSVKSSKKDASAKLAHEARKDGESLPESLVSLSGCVSESGAWSDTKFEMVESAWKVADDRTIGVVSDGPGQKVKEIKAKPPKETEVGNVEP